MAISPIGKFTSVSIIKDSSSPMGVGIGQLVIRAQLYPGPARNHKWQAQPFRSALLPIRLRSRRPLQAETNPPPDFIPFPTTTLLLPSKTLAPLLRSPAVGWDAVPPPPERRRLDVRMDGYRALIAAGATAVCCLVCAVWAFRSSSSSASRKQHQRTLQRGCCGCARCGCRAATVTVNGEMAVGGEQKKALAPAPAAAAAGASMMEQLVPEITTHALSYLDYTSLCRLSMTNSAMRRAANDDGAWKALYHKDFTVEQHNITPPNGWKAYYAATKAIMNVNTEFYNIIREGSLPAMSHFWLNADYVKCIHATGELFTGYNAVMDSWGLLFNWGQDGGQGIAFQLRDVRARILGEVAWVNMKAHVDVDPGPFHVTNVYEFRNGRWYMVHHHSSLMADPAPHNLFA